MDTKDLYSHAYGPGGFYSKACNQLDVVQTNEQYLTILSKHIPPSFKNEASILEVGAGLGHLHCCHPNWQGVEYSDTAVSLGKETYGQALNLILGDARDLPVPSGSVDFLFSFATLEHVPRVEEAFAEIDRVLAPNGLALLCPAWNCRPWTVKKLQQRRYCELSLFEKVEKALIPLRNNLAFRLACSLPARAAREAKLLLGIQLRLEYSSLVPDFSLWEKYKHIADDDAFISIDAHAALCYFASRGWTSVSHSNFIKRFGCRGTEIVVQKPSVY